MGGSGPLKMWLLGPPKRRLLPLLRHQTLYAIAMIECGIVKILVKRVVFKARAHTRHST